MHILKGKKGQITLFIIIALIILIGAGIYFYMQSQKSGITELASIAEIPVTLDPVKVYVTNCLLLTTQEAITKVADQGGYANPIDSGFYANDADTTNERASAVRFVPGGELIIPYWLYAEGDNKNNCENCVFKVARPFLHTSQGSPSLQREIEKYIEQHVDACLGNFEEIKEKGFTVDKMGSPKSSIIINEEGVISKLLYPLKLNLNDNTFTTEEFVTEEKIRLKELYELGSKIMELQAEYTYFERQFIELLSIYSRVDNTVLPPPSATGLDITGGERWIKEDVKRRVQAMIQDYTSLTQVYGTANFRPYYTISNLSDQVLNSMMLIPINEDHTDIKVHFSYLNIWPMYFDLNCDGQICQSQSFTQNFMAIFGFQQYNFAYDLSYPILVELIDRAAFNGKGVSFKYFLEANVRNNQAFAPDQLPLPGYGVGTGNLLFCDKDLFTSGNVTFHVTSRGENVSDALISFYCGDATCVIGGTNSFGILTTPLPRCAGGIVRAQFPQQFSFPGSENINTFTDREQTMDLIIEPHRSFNVSVQRLLLKKAEKYGPWTLYPMLTRLEQKEMSLITLKRIGKEIEEPFSAVTVVWGDPTEESMSSQEDFRLVPGTYEISITNILESPLTIPEDVRDIETGFFQGLILEAVDLFSEEEITEITFPEMYLNQSVIGGTTFNWTVTGEQLDSGDKIAFTTLDVDLLNTPEELRIVEDLSEINSIQNYSQMQRSLFEPRIT